MFYIEIAKQIKQCYFAKYLLALKSISEVWEFSCFVDTYSNGFNFIVSLSFLTKLH